MALLAVAGAVLALVRRTRDDLVLLSFGAVYAALAPHLERALRPLCPPLVPVVAVLAARTPPLAVATLVACVVPLWWSVADARSLTGRDPRLDAAAWIERNVPRTDRVAADSSTLPLARPERPPARASGAGTPVRRRPRPRATSGARRPAAVVEGSVADRVLDAAADYPREARFYRDVARLKPVFATEADPERRPRPWLRVYRIHP